MYFSLSKFILSYPGPAVKLEACGLRPKAHTSPDPTGDDQLLHKVHQLVQDQCYQHCNCIHWSQVHCSLEFLPPVITGAQ